MKRRRALVLRIGALIRGDWSGSCFDGRDVDNWLRVAMDGTDAELRKLDATLTEFEADE